MIRCRRGVSGVISGLFLVLVFLLALLTHMMVQTQQRAYDQSVEERSQRDLERLNEKVEFIWARIDDDDQLVIIFHNFGGVTARIVDFWIRCYEGYAPDDPLWQRCDALSIYIEPGQFSTYIPSGTFYESLNYTVKFVTERGNIASVHVPYPPLPKGGAGGLGFYPIIIESTDDNFQYQDLDHPGPVWSYAWIKDRTSPASQRVVYRVLVNNTTDKTIEIDSSTIMLQSAGTGNQVPRLIVSPECRPNDEVPEPFDYQEIGPKKITYLYFAAHPGTFDWVADPNIPYCPVSFLVNFRYAGEPDELLTLGLPVQVMQIN